MAYHRSPMGQGGEHDVIDFDLRNPDHVRDPYPVFARLRQDDPVHRSESSAVQRPSIPRAVFATRTCQWRCGSPIRDVR